MGHRSSHVNRLLLFVVAGVLFQAVPGSMADVVVPPLMPVYTNPARVNEIATDGSLRIDYPSWISDDGLHLLFNSNRKGGHTEMFLISRPDTHSPFGTPTQALFVNVNGGTGDTRTGIISPNGLELFYNKKTSTAPSTIYRATRVDPNLPFSNPEALENLKVNPNGVHEPQRISSDGLRLYWIDTTSVTVPTTGQYVSSRPDLNSPFGTPSNAPFVNLGYSESIYLTADELQLLYINESVLKWTWRPDLDTPFAPGVPLTSLTYGFSQLQWDHELFFAHQDDVWSATLLPEPSTTIAALLVVMSTLNRRFRRPVRRAHGGVRLSGSSPTRSHETTSYPLVASPDRFRR